MTIDIPTLMSDADWWETVGYVASAVVVIGIIIESVEIYRHLRAGTWRKKLTELIGFSLVVLGLVVEVLSQVQSNRRTGLVIAALNAEASEAMQQAGNLGVSFGNLNKFVSDQEKRNTNVIAELNRDKSDLDAASKEATASVVDAKKVLAEMQRTLKAEDAMRQQMHELLTPRILSVDQTAELIGKLKPFGKVPFMLTLTETPEAIDFTVQVSAVLENAGWDWQSWDTPKHDFAFVKTIPNKPDIGIATIRGILIEIASSDLASLERPANAFRDALAAAGIPSNIEVFKSEDSERNHLMTAVIHIFIGSKQ
jgi:hypothetical protein